MSYAYHASRISPNMARTQEGFLLCTGVPLCRSGEQTYRADEIGASGSDTVTVFRPVDEVQSKTTLASLEGKPVTDDHPPTFLSPANATAYARGHAQNIRRSRLKNGEACLVGDLMITDDALIQKVLHGGKREISVGYETNYVERGDGTFEQRDIRANHIAVVATGRAGADVRIMDAAERQALDFVAATRRCHRRNPSEVAQERKAETRDGIVEEMRASGRPRSWSELAEEVETNMTSETKESDSVAKTKDLTTDERLDKLLGTLERLVALLQNHDENEDLIPASANDSGDRSYENVLKQYRRNPHASDSEAFVEATRRHHRRNIGERQQAAAPVHDETRRQMVADDQDRARGFVEATRRFHRQDIKSNKYWKPEGR